MKLFFKNLKPFRALIALAILMLCVQAFSNLKLPDLMSEMVNEAIKLAGNSDIATDTTNVIDSASKKSMDEGTSFIWLKGGEMVIVTLVGAIASIIVSLIASHIGTGVARNLRKEVYQKVMSFSQREYNDFSTASLITRNTNDIAQLQRATILGIKILCFSPILGVGGIIMALRKSTSLGWIIVVSLLVIFMIIGMVFVFITPKFKRLQTLTDKINLIARENLTGLMIIRAFNTKDHETERFDDVNTSLKKISRIIMATMGGLFPTMLFVLNMTAVAILWYGGKEISIGGMQVGDMMAFIQYSMQIIMSFLIMTAVFVMIPRAAVSLGRIEEVLNTPVLITTKDDAKVSGYDIEFEDVCFKYGEAENNVLDHVSFTAEEGKTTAIIGSTGSGKSTILQLIPRLFDVTSGSVRIGRTDVRDMDLVKLRNMVGYVPQKGVLFKGSFASNLRFGDEHGTDEEIAKALEIAQAKEFTLEADGIEGEVAQGGSNLSGGQKQRVAIARAIIKEAPIYIFDDTFSALDYKTERALRMALQKEMSKATVIIVAQRVSTIRDADKIIVLEDGKIVGVGKHEDLMRECSVYSEIAQSQRFSEVDGGDMPGNQGIKENTDKGGEVYE